MLKGLLMYTRNKLTPTGLSADNQLFYTGPSRQYMRLVVVSEEQKLVVLQQNHCNPDTGNHYGVRRTRDKVVSGYYWPTISNDVNEWVRTILVRTPYFPSAFFSF